MRKLSFEVVTSAQSFQEDNVSFFNIPSSSRRKILKRIPRGQKITKKNTNITIGDINFPKSRPNLIQMIFNGSKIAAFEKARTMNVIEKDKRTSDRTSLPVDQLQQQQINRTIHQNIPNFLLLGRPFFVDIKTPLAIFHRT